MTVLFAQVVKAVRMALAVELVATVSAVATTRMTLAVATAERPEQAVSVALLGTLAAAVAVPNKLSSRHVVVTETTACGEDTD